MWLFVQINTKDRLLARQNGPEKDKRYKLSISEMRKLTLLQMFQVLRGY